MKTKLYVRVAQGRGRPKVAANVRPNHWPITEQQDGADVPLPTAFFALELDIPQEVFDRAVQVAATVKLDPEAGQVIVLPLAEAPSG